MPVLPEADPATRAFFEDWLERFSGYVRDVDYAAARPLWHPEVLAFGTHADIVQGLERYIASQWDNVWPRTSDFRFDAEHVRVLTSDDDSMAVVIASWTSTGFAPDGARFDRPGRATMVFYRADGDSEPAGWKCVHSHMSLNRGVPQESHGNRPVKGR